MGQAHQYCILCRGEGGGKADLGTWGCSPGDDISSGLSASVPSRTLLKSVSSSSPSWTVPGSVTLISGPRLSNSMSCWARRASYFLRRATRSRSDMRFLRRLGGWGGMTRHSTPALTQLLQGLFLSQRTFLCWQRTQDVPRVTLTTLDESGTGGACGADDPGEALCLYGSPSVWMLDSAVSDMLG
jgi:hypothetical protein